MSERQFVSLPSTNAGRNGAGFYPCQGLYYTPKGKTPKIAFIACHYNVDFSEHYLAEFLVRRGFGFLGWNTRFRGNEAFFLLDHALVDIGCGVRWLQEKAGVNAVVLLGNSGGGSLMAAYQSQAVEPNVHSSPGMALAAGVIELIPGDYYVSLNAHGGRPEVLTAWMDPSVMDETDPTSVDESLNMFNPENGPPYSQAFISRYRAAQTSRNHHITGWVLEELARLESLGMQDRAFGMYRTWADLRLLDGNIDPSQRVVGKCYAGDPKKANFSPRGIGLTNTLRTWLSMWSLSHSQCRGAPHLKRIHVPALVIQSLGDSGVFPSDATEIFDNLASLDKKQELIAGDHYLTEPETARAQVADLITRWLEERLA